MLNATFYKADIVPAHDEMPDADYEAVLKALDGVEHDVKQLIEKRIAAAGMADKFAVETSSAADV